VAVVDPDGVELPTIRELVDLTRLDVVEIGCGDGRMTFGCAEEAASVLAFLAWNRGVTVVGANAAGFTLPLLPAFGTVLAIVFLGEAFQGFHAAGFLTIVAGVVLATDRGR